jgi:hypothetical protein
MPLKYSSSMPRNPRSDPGGGKPVSELLNTGSPGLGQLLQQARKLDYLDRKLAAIL